MPLFPPGEIFQSNASSKLPYCFFVMSSPAPRCFVMMLFVTVHPLGIVSLSYPCHASRLSRNSLPLVVDTMGDGAGLCAHAATKTAAATNPILKGPIPRDTRV